MIGPIEKKTAQIVGWLYLETRIIPVCDLCARGRRVERRGFWNYIHPNSKAPEKAKRCTNPYWWILHPPKGQG